MEVVFSINRVPIRLTDERWQHIISNKPYMERYYDKLLEALERPNWVLQGYSGSLIAITPVARKMYLHVVYKEISRNDGFIITAFVAKKFNRRMIIWPQHF